MALQKVDQNADLIGTVAGSFNISGSNDQLQITIDGGAPQTVTLTHGATRSAAQVVADINAVLAGATAYAARSGAYVRIRTTSTNGATSTIAIGSPANNANATLGFSAGTTIGYSRVNTTFIGGTKQNIIDNMITILTGVGWTLISGAIGSANVALKSGMTPPGQDLQVIIRIKDNAATCVQFSLENIQGTLIGTNSSGSGGHVLPAGGKTFRVIANKYWFSLFTPRPSSPRDCCFAGTGFLPTWLQGIVTDAGWLRSNAGGDTDTNGRPGFREGIGDSVNGTTFTGNQQNLLNGTLWIANGGGTNNGTSLGNNALMGMGYSYYQSAGLSVGGFSCGANWFDGSPFEYDAIMGWGPTGLSDAAKWVVQLPDALIMSSPVPGDTQITMSDGTKIWAITDNQFGAQGHGPAGTLFQAVP